MKTTLWLFVSPLLVLVLALAVGGFSACGDNPLYACPDPSRPCVNIDPGTDASADADAGD